MKTIISQSKYDMNKLLKESLCSIVYILLMNLHILIGVSYVLKTFDLDQSQTPSTWKL